MPALSTKRPIGLLKARKVVTTERLRDPQRRPLLVLLTDGKATVPAEAPAEREQRSRKSVDDALRSAALLTDLGVASVVVDCENGPVKLGMADRIAGVLDAPCLRLEELSADNVAGVVRAAREGTPQPT